MYDVLFHIPHQILGWPLFGWGLAATVWLLIGGGWLAWSLVRGEWSPDSFGSLVLVALGAAAFIWLAPRMEDVDPATGRRIGIAIHGYGVMVTLGVVSGMGLAVRESRRMGLNPDILYGLAMRMFLSGIAGARAFYVALNWDDYRRPTWGETLAEVVKFTEGGLVVYGAFLAAMVVGWFYVRSRKLPVLALADLIVPTLLLGLAFGRIGCFLHGCCFGGECKVESWSVTFPNPSPPYFHQLQRGRMHGLGLGISQDGQTLEVQSVDADGPASQAGLQVGDQVESINGVMVDAESATWFPPGRQPFEVEVRTVGGREVRWRVESFPARSWPVYPTQLYSSATAASLALLFWAWYPARRRDGELIAGLLTLYPVSRILEEAVRDDEPGRFGTPLTISQWVSLGLLLVGMALWCYLLRRPAGCARFDGPVPASDS